MDICKEVEVPEKILCKVRWDPVTGITPQLILSCSATLHRKPNVLDGTHTCTLLGRKPMQAQRSRTFSRAWSLGGVIVITKSLPQAELVLQSAAAFHYFTHLDSECTSTYPSHYCKNTILAVSTWPLFIINFLINKWRFLPDSTHSHCSNCYLYICTSGGVGILAYHLP